MTREEAIRCLYVHSSTNGSGLCTDEQHYEAKQMAIEALEQQPTEITWVAGTDGAKVAFWDVPIPKVLKICKILQEPSISEISMPPIAPQEPKTGHWISFGVQGEMDGGQIVQAFTCSECGTISIFRMRSGNIVNGDICPNCGAKMEVEQNG